MILHMYLRAIYLQGWNALFAGILSQKCMVKHNDSRFDTTGHFLICSLLKLKEALNFV